MDYFISFNHQIDLKAKQYYHKITYFNLFKELLNSKLDSRTDSCALRLSRLPFSTLIQY